VPLSEADIVKDSFAEALTKAYETFIEKEEAREPMKERRYVYASSWSACTRQIALDLIFPETKPQFSADTLANFRRGKDRARDIKADMTRMGRECNPPFDVVGAEERFELRDKKSRVCIVGKVDFRLKFEGRKGSAPVETKSYHPNMTQGVNSFEDMFRNRWLRKGAFQLLAYMLATNEPLGYMLLDRPGIPKILEVRLFEWLDRIEDFLQRAEKAMDTLHDHLHAKQAESTGIHDLPVQMPPFIEDPSECRVCSHFGVTCNPPLSYPGTRIFTDEEAILKTERFATLDAMPEIEEHQALEKYVKKTFRGVLSAICGKCSVTGKWQKNTVYDIPIDVAAQIDALKEPYKKTIEQGKFFVAVTKVSE